MHSLKGITSFTSQLNYLTDIVLELKANLAKIKVEVKEIKNQLAIIYLSLINEIRHSGKYELSLSTPFQHKYPFQNPKIKNLFSRTKFKNLRRS